MPTILARRTRPLRNVLVCGATLAACAALATPALAGRRAVGGRRAAGSSRVLFATHYPSHGTARKFGVTGWGHVQYPSDDGVPQPDRIEFGPAPGSANDPFKPNTNVARFELEPYYINGEPNGDITDTGGYLANRVEFYDRIADHATPAADWPDPVGSTRWYSFSIYIPPNFPEATSSSQWFDFVQWKGFNTGSPPVAMEIRHNEFVLGGANSDQHLATIIPGQWTQFVIGLHFSDSATTGWETAYVDNKPIVDQAPTKTMNDYTSAAGVTQVDPDYLKMGIYRSVTWTVTQVIYLSPMTITATQPQ
jgi:hypothetical protein